MNIEKIKSQFLFTHFRLHVFVVLLIGSFFSSRSKAEIFQEDYTVIMNRLQGLVRRDGKFSELNLRYLTTWDQLRFIDNVMNPKIMATNERINANAAAQAATDKNFAEEIKTLVDSAAVAKKDADLANSNIAATDKKAQIADEKAENALKQSLAFQNSLRENLQKLLLAQTCEDPDHRITAPEGSQQRKDQVQSQFTCIQKSLNNWKSPAIADSSALCRAQVVQLLKSLELLFHEDGLNKDQMDYISATERDFVYFNMQ